MHGLAHQDGELATATAARKANTIYTMSTLATTGMEEVAKHEPNALKWFQLHIMKDRRITEAMVREAERLGFKAIALSVDAPCMGLKKGDERKKFALPDHLNLEVLARFEAEF